MRGDERCHHLACAGAEEDHRPQHQQHRNEVPPARDSLVPDPALQHLGVVLHGFPRSSRVGDHLRSLARPLAERDVFCGAIAGGRGECRHANAYAFGPYVVLVIRGTSTALKSTRPSAGLAHPAVGRRVRMARSVIFIPDGASACADAGRLTQICRNRLPPRPCGSRTPTRCHTRRGRGRTVCRGPASASHRRLRCVGRG